MNRRLDSRVEVLRNGVKLTELAFYDPPDVISDKESAIKTSLMGEFKYNPAVNYFTDEISPVVTIDGAEHRFGIYRVGTMSTRYGEAGQRFDRLEAYDRAFNLQQAKTESIYHINVGTNYVTAVETMLTVCGITAKIITPTTSTLATAREDWEIGTDYLTIVNQLLSEINYNPIWFNADGYAIVEPYKAPSAESIDHIYDATTEMSITMPECSEETDIFALPNVFVAIVSNADLATPMTATAENNNPNSAASIMRRGMRITGVNKLDNIASQEELQNYVNRLRNESMYASEVITIRTAIMPGHGIGDTVALNHPSAQGLYEETGWQIKLAAGQFMTHKLRKVVYD